MKRFYVIILVLFVVVVSNGLAQSDSTQKRPYTPNTKLKDGVYFSPTFFQMQNPLPKSRIVTSVNYDHPQFFDNLLIKKEIKYFDNLGQQKSIATTSVWGYVDRNVLYIKANGDFARVTMVGSVCHFIANYTSYDYPGTTAGGAYYYDPYTRSYPVTSNEIRQYMFDFTTGKLMDYTVRNLEIVFTNDPELQEEYLKLSNKKQRKQKFIYLRKYNERNPLMLQAN